MNSKALPTSTGLSRRQLLTTGGVFAGALLLEESIAAGQKPAANVADRASSIRITALQATLCRDRVFVKIDTNHDISGWGEIKGIVPTVAKTLAEALADLLVGENPTRIEHLWQRLFRAHRNQRGGAFMVHCIAAIDNALWDIAGKFWGVPVYRLLGGPAREKLRYYPHAKARKAGTGPNPQSSDPVQIDRLVNMVRQTRQQVGPDGAVMFDAHSAVPPASLLQFAAAIEPYDVLFIEEPAVPGNIEVFKRLKAQIRVPLAAGERDRTIWGIIPYLVERVLDVVQPDCGYTGGISQMKKIATLAEAFHVPLAPHCTQSLLGQTASFHAAASVPLFLIHESYEDRTFDKIFHPHWKKEDGHVLLPEGVGLCIDVDEAALAKMAADKSLPYRWPGARNPDGSVADY